MKLPPCIILCGGIGSRLQKISHRIPKCLVQINKKPFLYYQLKSLESSGLKKVVLSSGHLGFMINDFLKKFDTTLEIILIDDGKELLGTGGAVKKAFSYIDEPAFVTYGDTYLDISYTDMYKYFLKNNKPVMSIYKNNSKYDLSNVYKDEEKITYNKKNPNPNSQYIEYGLSIFYEENFKSYGAIFDLSDLQESLSKSHQLCYFEALNRFYEIGTPNSLKETINYFSNVKKI